MKNNGIKVINDYDENEEPIDLSSDELSNMEVD